MQIRLRNEIDLDGQIEVVDQIFPVDVKEKDGSLYLLYTNEEREKVAIKCGEAELTMTRFTNPKSIMRFLAGQEAIVALPTPLGIQHFITATKHYHFDSERQELVLHYDLKTMEGTAIFASYQMEISWK